jgi:hypothetical protein
MKSTIWTTLMTVAVVLGTMGVASAQSGDAQFDEEVRRLGEVEQARRIEVREERREVAVARRATTPERSYVPGQLVGGLLGGVTLGVGAAALSSSVCQGAGVCPGGFVGMAGVTGVGFALGTAAGVALAGPRDASMSTHMAALGGAGAGLLAGGTVGVAVAVAGQGSVTRSALAGVAAGSLVTVVAAPTLATVFHHHAYDLQLSVTPTFREDGGGFAMYGRF